MLSRIDEPRGVEGEGGGEGQVANCFREHFSKHSPAFAVTGTYFLHSLHNTIAAVNDTVPFASRNNRIDQLLLINKCFQQS
jgi:hypothetical protein